MIRTYSELITIPTFEERFKYLKLDGVVGRETFGFNRYLNQKFYLSKEWIHTRDYVIVRDMGCDLAISGREIFGKVFIHHLNPISADDILNRVPDILDPEFLICAAYETHNAIHYGDADLLAKPPVERKPNDTCPWK